MSDRSQQMCYIIIVNWNGWRDTIECLESVFRMKHESFRVIVCDNGSTDQSLNHIEQWAQGELAAKSTSLNSNTESRKPVSKPIGHRLFQRDEVLTNRTQFDLPLLLVRNDRNGGFAGGNNLALRLALSQQDMTSAWLLNNDTVVNEDALGALLRKSAQNSNAGMIGSTLLYYDRPEKVQAFGGARFYPLIGLSVHIGRFFGTHRPVIEGDIEKKMDYAVGASMLVTREFLSTVGLMSEEYFLYYEELDWALRAKHGFVIGYARESLVYHKAGASIGSSNTTSRRSLMSDYYLMRNRLVITRKFFPQYLLSVRLFMLVEVLIRVLNGNLKQASNTLRLAFNRDCADPASTRK